MEWVLEIADFLEENNIDFSVEQSNVSKIFYIKFPDNSAIVYQNNLFHWEILIKYNNGKYAIRHNSTFDSTDDLKKQIIKFFKE